MKNKKYKQIVKFIIEYIEKNLEIQQIHKKRGRPAIYHTKLILTALILKTFLKLSFRDTQDLLEDLFPNKPIPDFSTLFYRFKNLDKQLVENLIKDLAEIIRQKMQVKEFHTN
ncbi:MAG: transposase [Caldimicrobium sp.]